MEFSFFLSSDIPVFSFLLWFQKFVDQCYQVKELIELFLFQKDETKVKEICIKIESPTQWVRETKK